MLQLIFAISLQDRVPGLEVSGYDMPLWNLSKPARIGWRFLTPSLRLCETDGMNLAGFFESGLLRRAKVRDLPLRCAEYAPPSRFQSVFPLPVGATPVTGADELLINVRGAETLGAVHQDYGPVPVDWYRRLIRQTGLKPVFLGQLGEDFYSDLLRSSFPTARFVPSRGPMADFAAIRLATHLAVSVSTFSWLAAWLSNAKSIHLPLLGIFNPNQRPDIWMLPMSDDRYHSHSFPVRYWTASESQIAALSARQTDATFTKAEINALASQMETSRAAGRSKALAGLRARALLSHLPQIGA